MKFLLDQGLPRSTVAELANRGISVEHVGDLGWVERLGLRQLST